MIPIADNEGTRTAETILKEYEILRHELEAFNPELLDKKYLVAITKCDMAPADEIDEIMKKLSKPLPVINISSLTNYHLTEIKDQLWGLLNT